MEERVKIRVVLQHPGAGLDTYGWPEFRRFMDFFVTALAAMPSGLSVSQIVPVKAGEGSLALVLSGPVQIKKARIELWHGPTEEWTQETFQSVVPLWDFIEAKGGCLRGERGHGPILKIPKRRSSHQMVEYGSLYGNIMRVGGNDGVLQLKADEGSLLAITVGRKKAKEYSKLLYERVCVSGVIVRDALTGTIQSLTEPDVRHLPEMSIEDGLGRVHELLRGDVFTYDPATFMREIRE